MKKKILSVVMFSLMLFSVLSVPVLALEKDTLENDNDELTALKETVKNEEKVGEYDVNISVPGYESEKISGYNIIFVMDGSNSTNGNKWKSMRNSLLETIDELLPYDDVPSNVNRVALITFGIDYHINVPLTNNKEFFADTIPGESGGDLLAPGTSGTNIEVGLKGAREYLESIEGTDLEKDDNHTIVILMTDGEVNMSEVPFNFYDPEKSSNYELLFGSRDFSSYIEECFEIRRLLYAILLSEISENDTYVVEDYYREDIEMVNTLYDSIKTSDEDITIREKIDLLRTNEATKDSAQQILDDGVLKLYSLIGYDLDSEITVGEYERLFTSGNIMGYEVLDDILFETYFQMIWCVYSGSKVYHADRAVAEGNRLDEIATIYTIGYGINDSRADAFKILDPNFAGTSSYTANNPESHYSTEFNKATTDTLKTILEKLFLEIVEINYKNIEMVDYTSKWVNPMDINGDGVFDKNDITITNDGQVVSADVQVKELECEDIELLGDKELNDNTNGSVYRITWRINGYLHSWDKYKLSYRIKVDTNENGFVSENEYHANGNVILIYDVIEKTTDSDGTEIETIVEENVNGKVDVLDLVSQKENIIVITKTDENGNLLSGADFEISSEENNNTNIIKEYSTDGINWKTCDISNSNYDAMYFRFSGLYDYKYTLSEIKTPKWYIGMENKVYDFTNLEGQLVEDTIENIAMKGEVIIHYVVKVSNEYIPFNEFAYDEEGNLLTIFEGINLEDVILTDNIGIKFETYYANIESLTLNGLYTGNLIIEQDNLNKLVNDKFVGTFTENIQEFTYVYEINVGSGSEQEYPLPPQTGYEVDGGILYMLLICMILLIKKVLI